MSEHHVIRDHAYGCDVNDDQMNVPNEENVVDEFDVYFELDAGIFHKQNGFHLQAVVDTVVCYTSEELSLSFVAELIVDSN